MTKLTYVAGAGLLLLAAGCTETRVVSSPYEAQLTQFLNQPDSTAVASWGAPSVETKLANGGEAMVWVVLDSAGTAACSTVLTSDSGKIVRNYSYAGNGCHAPTRTADVISGGQIFQ